MTYFLPPALERIKNTYCMGQRPFLYLYIHFFKSQNLKQKSFGQLLSAEKTTDCISLAINYLSFITDFHLQDIICTILLLPTRKATRPKGGQEWCLHQAFRSTFGVMWPWPLTSWPPKLTVSCPCLVDHLCQLASKLVHSFSKYHVHKSSNRRTKDGWKNGLTDSPRTQCLH